MRGRVVSSGRLSGWHGPPSRRPAGPGGHAHFVPNADAVASPTSGIHCDLESSEPEKRKALLSWENAVVEVAEHPDRGALSGGAWLVAVTIATDLCADSDSCAWTARWPMPNQNPALPPTAHRRRVVRGQRRRKIKVSWAWPWADELAAACHAAIALTAPT
jgi:hypothetical protein